MLSERDSSARVLVIVCMSDKHSLQGPDNRCFVSEWKTRAFTFNSDNMHAIHRVQRAQAGISRPVLQLPILHVGEHHCTSAAPTLTTPKFGACEANLCMRQAVSMAAEGRPGLIFASVIVARSLDI